MPMGTDRSAESPSRGTGGPQAAPEASGPLRSFGRDQPRGPSTWLLASRPLREDLPVAFVHLHVATSRGRCRTFGREASRTLTGPRWELRRGLLRKDSQSVLGTGGPDFVRLFGGEVHVRRSVRMATDAEKE